MIRKRNKDEAGRSLCGELETISYLRRNNKKKFLRKVNAPSTKKKVCLLPSTIFLLKGTADLQLKSVYRLTFVFATMSLHLLIDRSTAKYLLRFMFGGGLRRTCYWMPPKIHIESFTYITNACNTNCCTRQLGNCWWKILLQMARDLQST